MTKAELIAARNAIDEARLRKAENDILAAVANLHSDDDSFRANYLHQVAESILDHRANQENR